MPILNKYSYPKGTIIPIKDAITINGKNIKKCQKWISLSICA